ncbi:hypothetical protein [Zoogloea sp.]|uniref:hypothetical protein n=1 Tax=Zoogloea sp. TaxID=49181 RepID=UPI0035B07A7C
MASCGFLPPRAGVLAVTVLLVALPAHKLAVVVLSNSAGSGAAVERIANEVLSVALEARSGLRAEALILGQLADSGETVQCRKADDAVECRFAGYVLTRVGD